MSHANKCCNSILHSWTSSRAGCWSKQRSVWQILFLVFFCIFDPWTDMVRLGACIWIDISHFVDNRLCKVRSSFLTRPLILRNSSISSSNEARWLNRSDTGDRARFCSQALSHAISTGSLRDLGILWGSWSRVPTACFLTGPGNCLEHSTY